MPEIRDYVLANGRSPFGRWFARPDTTAAQRVTLALAKIEAGYSGNIKSVGQGVQEYRIKDHGGLRIYFAYNGDDIIILLGGGNKHKQSAAIAAAQAHWQHYLTTKDSST